jgi:serine/threonine protein kinase
VKPENILIDRADDGKFVAKLADFGYSNAFAEDEVHVLPISQPWNAPEITSFEVDFDQGRSADIYSFSMVCFWMLFYHRSPEDIQAMAGSSLSLEKIYSNVNYLEELKHSNRMGEVARRLASTETGVSPLAKDRLAVFFDQTLVKIDKTDPRPSKRETEILKLLRLLESTRFVVRAISL